MLQLLKRYEWPFTIDRQAFMLSRLLHGTDRLSARSG
jgi:hypothetical protein